MWKRIKWTEWAIARFSILIKPSRQTLLKPLAIYTPINKMYFNIYVKSSFEIQEFYCMHFLLLRLSGVYLNRKIWFFGIRLVFLCGEVVHGVFLHCICCVTELVISCNQI